MNKEWRHIATLAFDFYEDQVEEAMEEIEAMKEGEKRASLASLLERYVRFIGWLFNPCDYWQTPKYHTLGFQHQISFRQWRTYMGGEDGEWGVGMKLLREELILTILEFENVRPNNDAKDLPMRKPKYVSVSLTASNWIRMGRDRGRNYKKELGEYRTGSPAPSKPKSRGQL